MHTRVRLQDIDWPRTQTATTWEVVGVQVDPNGSVFDRHKNRREDSFVTTVTLRRSFR